METGRSAAVAPLPRRPLALSTRLLVVELVAVAILGGAVFAGWEPPRVLGHGWHVFLHVLGAVLFLGNVLAGALLVGLADAAGSRAVDRFVSHAILWADVVLTGPGILLLLSNGAVLVGSWGGVDGTRWMRWSVLLFIAAGALWVFVLVPMQHRLTVLADEPGRERWVRVLRLYTVPGSIAALLSLVVLALMVLRPT